jgi:xanthine dehydrogenase accessory factor
MKELQEILDLWAHAEAEGESAVLATVVKTRGSSYRSPGARLLLTSGGQHVGSISGGCLEDDLLKKAWWLTQSGPVIRRYDTTPEGEIATEFGLGCHGVIHVLLERILPGDAPAGQVQTSQAQIIDVIRELARSERRPAAIAHVIEPSSAIGQRLVLDPRGNARHNLSDPELARTIASEAARAPSECSSRLLRMDSGIEVFLEVLPPVVRLLVFGAGYDAVPLTRLAKYLGWRVTVLDGRAHYARREKFPDADEVLVRPAGHSGLGAEIDPWTVAVVMSHSYSQDLETIRELAGQPLRYLGILGPRKRASQLLADAGLDVATLIPVLHTPIGLDIGADGPEQVALAILAEIQATLNGRKGGSLRDHAGSIHSRDESSGDPESLWVQSIACA